MKTFLGRDNYDWAGFGLLCLVLGSMVAVMLSCDPAQAVEEGESIVVETIMMESADQSYQGQLAVAEVIRNRAKRSGLPAWKEVMRPKQFSCWNSTLWAKAWLVDHATGEAYQMASRAWQEALDGSETVKGATLYHTVKVSPTWSKSPRVHFVKQVGSHLFYTEDRS